MMGVKRLSEDDVQIALVQYIKLKYPWIVFYHTPNGGSRNKIEAAKLKKMGTMAGVADFYFMNYKLYLELKVEGRKQSHAQKEFEKLARATGHSYYLCDGLDIAMKFVDDMVRDERLC